MKISYSILATAVLLHATATAAQAEDTPKLTFNGYGTAGVVRSDEDRADFTSSVLAPDGAGYTRDWSPEVDSRLGLQLTADLPPRLTGILQVITEQQHDGDYDPTVEWANLRFNVTPALTVRAGRMVLPTFMASEFRKVGYANPWVRPPQEVYRVIPVTSVDGIAVAYRARFDGSTNTLQATYGGRDAEFVGGEIEARNGLTVANTLEWGGTSLFASYNRTRLRSEAFSPFFDPFRRFGPDGRAIADRFDLDGKRFELIAAGARHDAGDWFAMGEWMRARNDSILGDSHGWYVTGGYRHGTLTPYVTVARLHFDSDTSHPGLPLADLPPEAVQAAASLNAGLNLLQQAVAAEQKSVSVGLRWDFARSAALKLQYDRLDLGEGSAGVLANPQPGFEPGGSVNLFSITVDFVF
jgi:predicted porin